MVVVAESVEAPEASSLVPVTYEARNPAIAEEQACGERQCSCKAFMAWTAEELGGTETPESRRT